MINLLVENNWHPKFKKLEVDNKKSIPLQIQI